MGRAKNLPVGGKGAGVCRRCLLTCPPSRGRSSLPLAGASEPPAGVRMTRGGAMCICWRSRLRGEILPAFGRRKRTACGRQDDTRRAGRVTLKDLNQTRQQYPPHCMSFITPPNSKQGSAHQTLSFRAGPIRMGRAKNLPVGGNGAGVRRQCEEPLFACGGEILPAIGRRKRTACGRRDDTRGGYVRLLAFPPAGGDPPCRWQAQANRLRASG